MKKLLLMITVLLSVCASSAGIAAAASPTSSALSQACQGLNSQVNGADCGGNSGAKTVTNIIRAALQILSWVAGIAAVIMIVIAGLKYVTSGGDSGSISSAKNTLVYAIVGLIIVLLAQVIVQFVLH